MYSPIEAMTSWATAVISSSLPAKWYEISRVLDNPARSPIRANDTWPKPTSAITSMVAVTICDRRGRFRPGVVRPDWRAGGIVEHPADLVPLRRQGRADHCGRPGRHRLDR